MASWADNETVKKNRTSTTKRKKEEEKRQNNEQTDEKERISQSNNDCIFNWSKYYIAHQVGRLLYLSFLFGLPYYFYNYYKMYLISFVIITY